MEDFVQNIFEVLHVKMIFYHKHCKLISIAQSDARPPGVRRSRVRSSDTATFFNGDWLCNHFYCHSLLTTDSSRVAVSYWRTKGYVLSSGYPFRKPAHEQCG